MLYLVVANKPLMPQWLSMDDAIAHCRAGASIWPWASIEDGIDPDVVLVGIGDNPTLEVMAAASLLRQDIPELRVRVVNVTDLFVLKIAATILTAWMQICLRHSLLRIVPL